MNIKTPFKCYWVEQPEQVYVVTDDTDTHYLCSWVDEDDNDDCTHYLKLTLNRLIENSRVVILKEEQSAPMCSPLVTISQIEYDNLVEEVNLLQELLAEANQKIILLESTNVNLNMEYPEQFKPVSEYTLADWDLAMNEGWVFEQNNGFHVTVNSVCYDEDFPIELVNEDGGHEGVVTLQGHFWEDDPDDKESIKRRIK